MDKPQQGPKTTRTAAGSRPAQKVTPKKTGTVKRKTSSRRAPGKPEVNLDAPELYLKRLVVGGFERDRKSVV